MDRLSELGGGKMPERDRTIEAILVDPMVRAVMKADRVEPREMERLLREVRSRLRERRNALTNAVGSGPLLGSDDRSHAPKRFLS